MVIKNQRHRTVPYSSCTNLREASPVATFISNFCSPELRHVVLQLKPRSLWRLITAVLGKLRDSFNKEKEKTKIHISYFFRKALT